MQEYKKDAYFIQWDEKAEIIRVKFFENFSKEFAKLFKKDALEIGKELESLGKKVRVLNDVSDIPDSFVIDSTIEALLVDSTEYAYKIASYGEGSRAMDISLSISAIVHFIMKRKDMRFFKTQQ
ncbi:MAG: hypothetical protein EOM19_00770, partial [Candidatus Moranbacteria bacterium]|nr:hypothetical protein [Candidatus Moranbacteria bacterium]